MKVYLDTCCYGRPFDDRTQKTVDDEATAIMTAIDVCHILGHTVVSSFAAVAEIDNIRNVGRRTDIAKFFADNVDEVLGMPTDGSAVRELTRAAELQACGIGVIDSHHLAMAEVSGVDFLLTTDKDFLNIAARVNSPVKVINPTNFLPEATK